MVVMMDIEVSCKGHSKKLSHFLDHVSHTVNEISALLEENTLIFSFDTL